LRLDDLRLKRAGWGVRDPHAPQNSRRNLKHRLQCEDLLTAIGVIELLGQERPVQRVDAAEYLQFADRVVERHVLPVVAAGDIAQAGQVIEHEVKLLAEAGHPLGRLEPLAQEGAHLVERAGAGQHVDEHVV